MAMRLALAMLLVAAVASQLPSAAVASNYTVGDEKGWNPDVDYTAWVKKHKPFYKGDWLSKHASFAVVLPLLVHAPARHWHGSMVMISAIVGSLQSSSTRTVGRTWCRWTRSGTTTATRPAR